MMVVLCFCVKQQGVNESLAACGVKPSNIFTTQVPGAFELPVTARLLAASKRVDVIINLGCITKDEEAMTAEHISSAVAQGLMQVGAVLSWQGCF
jgi:6,7-dimethyl-8-ribityllumazine synthase